MGLFSVGNPRRGFPTWDEVPERLTHKLSLSHRPKRAPSFGVSDGGGARERGAHPRLACHRARDEWYPPPSRLPARSVRGRAPLALAHPPPAPRPRRYTCPRRRGRGNILYTLIPKGDFVSPAGSVGRWTRATGTQRPLWEPPLREALSVSATRCQRLTCRFGRSLDACHRHAATPIGGAKSWVLRGELSVPHPLVSPAGRGSFIKSTPVSPAGSGAGRRRRLRGPPLSAR